MIGNFAKSKNGHDKNKIYVIIAEDAEYVYLCDGRIKPFSKPKKKKIKHIQIINESIEQYLLAKLENNDNITDEQIKYQIKKYAERFN